MQSSIIALSLLSLNFFLRESLDVLESEKLNLQDRCLCLEAEVLEKEEKLNLQEEEFQKQDAVRVQSTKELKAVAKHWTEKWQKVALTLQSTQEELEELKKNNSRNEVRLSLCHSLKIKLIKMLMLYWLFNYVFFNNRESLSHC